MGRIKSLGIEGLRLATESLVLGRGGGRPGHCVSVLRRLEGNDLIEVVDSMGCGRVVERYRIAEKVFGLSFEDIYRFS